MWRFILYIFFVTPFCSKAQTAKIDPVLNKYWSIQQQSPCIIVLKNQADLSEASGIQGKNEKAAFVFNKVKAIQLKNVQTPAYLQKNGIPYKTLMIVNAYVVSLNQKQAEEIAQLQEVALIAENATYAMSDVTNMPQSLQKNNGIAERGFKNYAIDLMGVSSVWDLGFKGQGVIIGAQDTGYDISHPAIRNRYAGWNSDSLVHDYHWHDAIHGRHPKNANDNNPCGYDVKYPCDDDKHGTHTMGTMLGTDHISGETIGIAPEARWIAARNMERGWGLLSTYLECFQWFLAPTDLQGENPDPTKAPHVINNSWGCVAEEGCNSTNIEILDNAVKALHAAGIVVVVSNGNDGPNCATTKNPAAVYPSSFSVGATNSTDQLANFSSKGPVNYNGTNIIKPDVSAPGVAIYSSIPGDAYASYNGTSMAGPQVAGVVALIISANPTLAGNVDSIENIIKSTCLPLLAGVTCGGLSSNDIPNNSFGWGRVNALAAVNKALGINTGIPKWSDDIAKIITDIQGNMSINNMKSNGIFHLYDAQGRVIAQNMLQTGDQRLSFSLPAGVYIYEIQTVTGGQSGKWIIQ